MNNVIILNNDVVVANKSNNKLITNPNPGEKVQVFSIIIKQICNIKPLKDIFERFADNAGPMRKHVAYLIRYVIHMRMTACYIV